MKKISFIQRSNVFLLLPVIGSVLHAEWIYFSLASAIFIASNLYHYFADRKTNHKNQHKIWKHIDWSIATLCFIYMFYFARYKTYAPYDVIWILWLLGIIAFFFLVFLKRYLTQNHIPIFTFFHPWSVLW